VDIFWNQDAGSKVKDVEVVFILRDREITESEGDQRRFDVYIRNWDFNIGNSSTAWLQVPDATPEGVFGALLRVGFSSEAELPRALEEFAHIQECAWARKMLKGFNA
jgi:hypothetical protein